MGYRPRLCEICGAEYRATYSKQRTCGRACGVRLKSRLNPPRGRKPRPPERARYRPPRPRKPPRFLECRWCGRNFSGRAGRKYCSMLCARAMHPHAKSTCEITIGNCSECGSLFVRRAEQVGAFCSERCGRRARKRQRKHTMRAHGQARGKRITIQSLGHRDGWRCHLCGKPVSQRRGNKQRDPSIDHLLPVSQGGRHSWDNVALAHRRCNTLRGADLTVQLLLIA